MAIEHVLLSMVHIICSMVYGRSMAIIARVLRAQPPAIARGLGTARPQHCGGSGGGTPPILHEGLGAARPPILNFKKYVLGGEVIFLLIETK